MKNLKTCFIIMPISDCEGYEPGHFKRVYEYIIKPACIEAGFNPIRADDVKKTNVIVIDILQKLVQSDLAICDLSSQNPNVLYELGIRQAFDLPVVFIKDEDTERIFDIQGYRDIEYKSSLRIDEVKSAIENIKASIIETFEDNMEDINSIVGLLGIKKAVIPNEFKISQDTSIILKSINELKEKISLNQINIIPRSESKTFNYLSEVESFNDKGETYSIGDQIEHEKFGIGSIIKIFRKNHGEDVVIEIDFPDLGKKQLYVKYAKLKKPLVGD